MHETRSICNFKHFQVSLIVLETKINLRHSSSLLPLLLFYIPHSNPTRKCHVGWRWWDVSIYLSLILSLLTTPSEKNNHFWYSFGQAWIFQRTGSRFISIIAKEVPTALSTVVGIAIRDAQDFVNQLHLTPFRPLCDYRISGSEAAIISKLWTFRVTVVYSIFLNEDLSCYLLANIINITYRN